MHDAHPPPFGEAVHMYTSKEADKETLVATISRHINNAHAHAQILYAFTQNLCTTKQTELQKTRYVNTKIFIDIMI